MRLILTSLLLTLTTAANAITTGQVEVRVYNGTGFTSTYVTLADGQVITKSAGVPASATPQPFSSALSIYAGITPSSNVQSLLGAANYAGMRTLMGLGSMAVQSDTNVAISGGAISGLTAFSILNSGSGAHNFQINHVGTLTAGHTLTYNINNAERTLSLSGNLTVSSDATLSGTNTGDQTLTSLLPAQSGHAGEYLTTNGTTVSWGAISTGITVGTTAISGGTSGRIMMSGSTVGELTPGSGVVTWLTTPTKANLNAAVSDDDPAYVGAANTFAAANTFNGDVTIATGKGIYFGAGANYWRTDLYNSILFDSNLVIGRSSAAGNTWGFENGGGFYFGRIYAGGSGQIVMNVTRDHVMDVKTFSSSQAASLAVYNVMTSSTSFEAFVIDWLTTSNVCRIGTDVGSGGGTARDVQLIRGGVVKSTLGANTTDHDQPVKLKSYIVSGLPSASTCGAGSMAFVTDATATTPYSTVAGGGSNKVLVISDGTDWIIH